MNNEERILSVLESLQKQISSLEKTTNEKFDTMEKSTNRRFDTMENRFDTMEDRFDTMEDRFDTMEDRFDTMENRLNTMEKSNDERFDALEKLIAKENELTRSELQSEIQNVYEEVKDLKNNFNDVEQITAKNWLDITRLKSVK